MLTYWAVMCIDVEYWSRGVDVKNQTKPEEKFFSLFFPFFFHWGWHQQKKKKHISGIGLE